VVALPWIFVAAMVTGVVTIVIQPAGRPGTPGWPRAGCGRARRLNRPHQWTRRYCLIGAGPAGLAVARRFKGVPFDWFETTTSAGCGTTGRRAAATA
jgi:hypothetical protein